MLLPRVVTAAILLAVLAAALMVPSRWPFLLILAVAIACAGWEWLRLTLPQTSRGTFAVLGGAVLGLIAMALSWRWAGSLPAGSMRIGPSMEIAMFVLIPLAVVVWVGGVSMAVVQGRSDAPPASRSLSLFCFLAVLAAWAAIAILFLERGAWFVVSLLALVWVADVAAYFGGRAFGKHKLAPRVSPGKTREGAIAGIAAAMIWVGVCSGWPGSFGAALAAQWTLPGALLIAALLGAYAIIGDLFESLLKRRAGCKDSSRLLPGHGGVFDRIDAILPVAPIAFLFVGVLS